MVRLVVSQDEIHRMAMSKDAEERKRAAEALSDISHRYYDYDNDFYYCDIDKAWEDLHQLIQDENFLVRCAAAKTLGRVFWICDEKQAWEDLIRFAGENSRDDTMKCAVRALASAFSHIQDKKQAWKDLHFLTRDIRSRVLYIMFSNSINAERYQTIQGTDKKQEWDIWDVLTFFTKDKDSMVRWHAAELLSTEFLYLPDKKQAWDDLIRIAREGDGIVQRSIVEALDDAFSEVPDKERAWEDLIRLAQGKSTIVRWGVVETLSSSFPQLTNKEKAWRDIHLLTLNEDCDIRWNVALLLGSVISNVPDKYKEQVWDDLHRLAKDHDVDVRRGAADALGRAFTNIPNKELSWYDLHNLAQDDSIVVRRHAARALGNAFPHIPNKELAWDDMHRLTQDVDSEVCIFAYHSLGRACIFKATSTGSDEEFRDEFKKALEFFEKSSTVATFFNPAKFCLPFYRSCYAITSERQETESEIQTYLAEAKSAIEGSESKEKLFEAVENLSNALTEVQKARDFEDKKYTLNAYRQYCENAADLLAATEKKAPGATKLIRRGLPIVDKKIKEILEEIQKKAKIACRQSKGTPAEEIACTVRKEVQAWYIGDQEQMTQDVDNLLFTLKAKIPSVPENKDILAKIDYIGKEKNLTKQYEQIVLIIALIPTINMKQEVTMVENRNINISGNARVGDIIQGNNAYIDKSIKSTFDAKEFSCAMEEILNVIKNVDTKDKNAELAITEFNKAKLQAEAGEEPNEIVSTMDNAIKYLKKSEEVVNRGINIGGLLIKAGNTLGCAISWL